MWVMNEILNLALEVIAGSVAGKCNALSLGLCVVIF